jgi:beta-mannanase
MHNKDNSQKGFTPLSVVALIVVILLIVAVGYVVYHKHSTAMSSATNPSKGRNTASSSLLPPSIPTSGAYLGAWINPNKSTGGGGGNGCTGSYTEAGCNEIAQLAAFNSANSKPVSILHVYTSFKAPLPVQTLNNIRNNGSIPLIDWVCTSVSDINSGSDDQTITAYADAIKAYGSPVFLRWYWEMNLNDKGNQACGGYNNGPAYVSAWQHIWTIFHNQGATNAAFVWCPSIQIQKGSFEQYYPGDKFVDWIAVDGYDRKAQGAAGFSDIFTSFYNEWLPHNKPMMIAETASFVNPATNSAEQASYIEGIQNDVPSKFKDFKAVVYFDSIGPAGDWSLQGQGVTAFSNLSSDSYFSYTGK